MRLSARRKDPSLRYHQHGYEETSSILGMRSSPPSHVFGDRRLPHIDAELEEFSVDPWCPQNGSATLISRMSCRTSSSVFGRHLEVSISTAKPSKPSAVPTDQRLRLDDCQSAQNTGVQTIQPRKYQPVDIAESRLLRRPRRRILSWWRSARFSASSEARDRSHPTSAYQTSLQRLNIGQKHHPICSSSPSALGLR